MRHITKWLLILMCPVLPILGCNESTSTDPDTQDFCAKIHPTETLDLDQAMAEYKDELERKTGVYVLEDGGGSLITRAWLSEQAKQSIDIQYFIFSTDNVGLIACDYLVRAADRGVKVRMLVDDILVDADLEDILTLSSHENIDIKIYNPSLNLGKSIFSKLKRVSTDFRGVNQRMHNKTFIVDGKVVITGGRNVADEYFDYDHEYNFRDRDVLLMGKAVADVRNSFELFWEDSLSQSIEELAPEDIQVPDTTLQFERLHQYACNPENFWPQVRTRIDSFEQTIELIKASGRFEWVEGVRFVSDLPGKNDGSEGLGGGGLSTSALIELVKEADSSIDIQSPYLVTSELSQGLFKEAIDRGVEVRILTNSLASTDNLEAFSGYQREREQLLQIGIRIFEYRPDAAIRKEIMTGELQKKVDFTPIFGLHAKTMVIDGEITVIGTFNLDPRSANLNTECIAIIPSQSISRNVLTIMEKELLPENAWETTLEFNPDSIAGNVKQIKAWTRKVVPKGIL